jgi:hypothetical protein
MSQERRIPYEFNGVRVVMANRSGPIAVAASRMSIEEARAFIVCIQKAIKAYCHELEKGSA